MHYLDNASTTRVCPEAADRADAVLRQVFANPSSLYAPGMKAQDIIEDARAVLAGALGFAHRPGRGRPPVLFTAGGSEACNLALLGLARARRGWGDEIVATGYEHPAVQNTLDHLQRAEGFRLTLVPPGADGTVDPQRLLAAVEPKTVLVAAMQLNNETGALLDVASLAKDVKAKNRRTALHVDAVQSFTKLDFHPAAWGVDSAALSAHKLHGPKGVGALYLREGLQIDPVLFGGGQEGGLRPGTENTAYIAAFATAVGRAQARRAAAQQTIAALHAKLYAGLQGLAGVVVNSPKDAWPGILNFSLPGVRSETMLHHLEGQGVYVSSGSACHKGKPSHTLTAMGLPKNRVETAIRVSLCGDNTEADIDAVLAGLQGGLQKLARDPALA